jgi:hypothetical protein
MKVVFTGKAEPHIMLVAGETWGNEYPLNIDPDVLRHDLRRITAKLNALSSDTAPGSLTDKRRELHGVGKKLYRLLPRDFLDEFADKRPGHTSLDIQGESPLPWELMAASDDDRFLAEELRISRWLHGFAPTRPVVLDQAVFAASDFLPGALAEVAKIGELLHPGRDPALVAETVSLYDVMNAGDFDLFHFAGHAKPDDASGAASLALGQNAAFTLDYMEDVAENSLARRRPIVFLNACGSAGDATVQTLFDHWAKEFIRRGAGAFIGSLWNIRSETANRFGVEVYKSIKDGEATTLGEAVDLARKRSVRDQADPTRLAYALYGKDNAPVSLA